MTQQNESRRLFLGQLAALTGGAVLMPMVSACSASQNMSEKGLFSTEDIPTQKPEDWDPIAYNRKRGNAGAIPKSYLDDINGPQGEKKHLGKHLPYVPAIDAALVPAGFIALMWGDPAKGHAKHPNAIKNESNDYNGHWYNWIRVQKAMPGAQAIQSDYPSWTGKDDGTASYAVFGGGEIGADKGKNTIYLAALPEGLRSGDTLRIYAHCLTHGEYVDFLTLS